MSAALRVAAPGPLTTVQDLGRIGYQSAGVPVAGALDASSLRLANALVGNPEGTAALEFLLQGPTLEVAADSVRVALAGTEAEIEIMGDAPRRLPAWRSVTLRRGERFRVGALRDTACAYLAVAGGFALAPCLGSAATYVRARLGGIDGRPLRQGDALPLVKTSVDSRQELALPEPPDLAGNAVVRVVLGPQHDHFTERALATFLEAEFSVSKDADRMGMRLDGPRLAHRDGYNIVSDGIATGAIQVPGTGQPILLLADHQTTGGYPKIATVISADLPRVGRRRPGDRLRFAAVEVAEAERLRRDQEAALKDLIGSLVPAPSEAAVDLGALYRDNLISGAVTGRD